MSENNIKKERSRAYPVMPLAEALVRIASINENLGIKGQFNRETIATGMGYSGLNGASARSVAALTHYGFLDREKDLYSLSSLAKKYLLPTEDTAAADAKREAALSPTLFAEIYEAFKGQVIPKHFLNRLVQEFGIQSKAAPEVERIFKETMKTAGILQDNNILNQGPQNSPADVPTEDKESAEIAQHVQSAQQSLPSPARGNAVSTQGIDHIGKNWRLTVSFSSTLSLKSNTRKQVREFLSKADELADIFYELEESEVQDRLS
jgi:hypothetical protein